MLTLPLIELAKAGRRWEYSMTSSRQAGLGATTKRVALFVLFVPSADRNGHPLDDQDLWVTNALKVFGELFGGATAMPPARGSWLNPSTGDLVVEEPVLVHCYADADTAHLPGTLKRLREFCVLMGRRTQQGEVALVVDSMMHSFILPQS